MNKYICKYKKYWEYVIDIYTVNKDKDYISIQYATKLSKQFLDEFKLSISYYNNGNNSQ